MDPTAQPWDEPTDQDPLHAIEMEAMCDHHTHGAPHPWGEAAPYGTTLEWTRRIEAAHKACAHNARVDRGLELDRAGMMLATGDAFNWTQAQEFARIDEFCLFLDSVVPPGGKNFLRAMALIIAVMSLYMWWLVGIFTSTF